MRYLEKSFTVGYGSTKAYRDNFDKIFGKKEKKPKKNKETCSTHSESEESNKEFHCQTKD